MAIVLLCSIQIKKEVKYITVKYNIPKKNQGRYVYLVTNLFHFTYSML